MVYDIKYHFVWIMKYRCKVLKGAKAGNIILEGNLKMDYDYIGGEKWKKLRATLSVMV